MCMCVHVIIFIDSLALRFCLTETINSLPLWVKPYVTKYDTFGRALKEMLTFFRVAQIKVLRLVIGQYLALSHELL